MVTGSAGPSRSTAGPSRTNDEEHHVKIVIVSPTYAADSPQFEQKIDEFLSALFGATDQSSDIPCLDRIQRDRENRAVVSTPYFALTCLSHSAGYLSTFFFSHYVVL